jgi:hypothetical protein
MWRLAGLLLGAWLCLVLSLAITACGSTPGLTLRCDGRCHVAPANLDLRPEPGPRPFPAR